MAEKVKLSKDGATIDFVQSEVMPTSLKKLRQSPEIEGFYRFVFENDLQNEAYEIMDALIIARKAKKSQARKDAKELTKATAAPAEKTPNKPAAKPALPIKSPAGGKSAQAKPDTKHDIKVQAKSPTPATKPSGKFDPKAKAKK
jgi:hypothetical protein